MHGKTRNALLGYGLDSELIDKIAKHAHTTEMLRAFPRKELEKLYSETEVKTIKAAIERQPIDDEVISAIQKKSGKACCYCGDGNSSRPYQIHHIDPYSETQDNNENNLLLVCPTHHSAIHANNLERDSQRTIRSSWYSIIKIASEYTQKGLAFPFGWFQALDFSLPPRPSELVTFAPLTPSTCLICYPSEAAKIAKGRIEKGHFLLVCGESGSGKSTYLKALGGLYGREGYDVFRYRFNKQDPEALKQISLFISTCVGKAILLLDDVNAWATTEDLQHIAKLVASQRNLRVIATWTNSDSGDESKLQTVDLPRQLLSWSDLRPAVIAILLKHEGEIVGALQKYESDRYARTIGLGSFNSSLTERIGSLGDRPKTVYEFIFGLRGDATAVDDEFRQLYESDRSDVPVLVAALEQIAGFEKFVSPEEAAAACDRIFKACGISNPTADWVLKVLVRQTQNRKLIKVRDRYTTIHRKWAVRLLAAGLGSSLGKNTTEELLKPEFNVHSANPKRLLLLWNWLKSADQARPFISHWVENLPPEDWSVLVSRAAEAGLFEISLLASEMHLLFHSDRWKNAVGEAFSKNADQIARLIYSATSKDWYWLHELSMTMAHACPETWAKIVDDWDRKSVAKLILESEAYEFGQINWTLNGVGKLLPHWWGEMADLISWDAFKLLFAKVEPGHISNLFEMVNFYSHLGRPLMRSMLKDIAAAMTVIVRGATLDNLRPALMDSTLMVLHYVFPDDLRSIFEALPCEEIGSQLSNGLPRHWRTVLELTYCTGFSRQEMAQKILAGCDLNKLVAQAIKYGGQNRYELRLLLHLLCNLNQDVRKGLAKQLNDLVRVNCQSKDHEAQSILTAYCRLDPELGEELSKSIGLQPEKIEDALDEDFLKSAQEEFRMLDAEGEDYKIDLFSEVPEAKELKEHSNG